MVDTATFRGVNRFRRQTWVEVEPPMCLVVAVAFRDTPGLTAWEEPWEGGAGRNAHKKKDFLWSAPMIPGDGRGIVNSHVCV